MEIEERVKFFKKQVILENQIIETAKMIVDNVDNIFVRETILGVSMDSQKHKSLLNALIGFHEKFAVIDERLTDKLRENLEKHIKLEQKAIETYQELWDNLEDDKEKMIIKFILNDEIRHHEFLKKLQKDLIENITFSEEDYWNWAWKDTEWGGGS